MNFFTLSPASVPENQVLFPSIRPTFEQHGHYFTHKPYQAEVILLDLHTRIADYDQDDVDYIIDSCKPICTWDEFDKGGLSNLDWPEPLTNQQKQIFDHIKKKNIPSIHFCRLLNKNNKYPPNVFPYEKPILHEEELKTPDELFNRPYDLFWIANSAPSREAIAKVFREDGRFKCNIVLGAAKIPFDEWLNQCRQSKMFIKASAGGFSDERLQALFSISAMVLERNDQLLAHPFTHGENCLMIDSPPTKQDLDTIFEYLNDKETLYYLYLNNYNYVKSNYSEQAWGNYYLNIMKKDGII